MKKGFIILIGIGIGGTYVHMEIIIKMGLLVPGNINMSGKMR